MRRARHAPNLLARKWRSFAESTADEHTAFASLSQIPPNGCSAVQVGLMDSDIASAHSLLISVTLDCELANKALQLTDFVGRAKRFRWRPQLNGGTLTRPRSQFAPWKRKSFAEGS